jgi:Vanadium chloroperoxidase N-terminal domain/PAP2 superfamily
MEDPILFWNDVCNEANRLDHTAPMKGVQGGPTRSSRATAMVHLAMHDAHFGVSNPSGFALYTGTAVNPYAVTVTPPLAVQVSASVSAAAHLTLAALYPEQAAMFAEKAQKIAGLNETNEAAHDYGYKIGRQILKLRDKDGAELAATHVYNYGKPHHREDPLNPAQEPLGVNWGGVKTFAVSAYHPVGNFHPFKGPDYNADHDEVLAKGGAASQATTTRTRDESVIGMYWAYDGAKELGTPPRLYNQIVQIIAKSKGNSVADNARLFALVNVAMGDAGIICWHWKYHYDLWRPVVGIREYDTNFGPDAVAGTAVNPRCDPFWRPFGAPKTNVTEPGARSFTPPFPAYPSGHATFGGAAFEMVRLFYRAKPGATNNFTVNGVDNIAFDFVSDELDGKSKDNDGSLRVRHERHYNSVAEAMYDNSVSRIYLGVHWRFDGTSAKEQPTLNASAKKMLEATGNIGGVPLGRKIAQDIFATLLVPSGPGVVAPV